MTQSKRLLILGSGFSKVVFPNMPIVTELADHLRQQEFLQEAPYDRLVDDPELLLSYLSLEQPWKEPPEALEDKALFVRVQRSLAKFIEDCEDQAFKEPIPDWAERLVEYLHQSKTPVITFNYDTVLERLNSKVGKGREVDLYDLALSIIWSREGAMWQYLRIKRFHFIKLHGSTNWFYSGVEGFPGEQVYFRPVDSDSPHTDGINVIPRPEPSRLLKDKVPLIIPPVAEKSRFYSNQMLRSLWWDARKALAEADEIFCIGYSLPPTDLTTKLLFRSVARPKRVFIVNKSASELKERYRKAFPETEEIKDDFDGEDAVRKMVDYLIGES